MTKKKNERTPTFLVFSRWTHDPAASSLNRACTRTPRAGLRGAPPHTPGHRSHPPSFRFAANGPARRRLHPLPLRRARQPGGRLERGAPLAAGGAERGLPFVVITSNPNPPPPPLPLSQALRARAAGEALPLKQYHNAIKRALITRFAGGAERLLDLACGRGGDIHKWFDAGVAYVLGVDLSPGEIEEAKRRYAEAAAKRGGGGGTVAEFRVCDTLGAAPFAAPPPFDAVSCMFAAHYFFVSEAAASTFLANVAANLKPGGLFFGTVPSGKRVMAAIRAGGGWPHLDTRMLKLGARWAGDVKPFGCGYTCAIGDTVTAAVDDAAAASEGSFEYLVFFSAFTALAGVHGLEPVAAWGRDAEALLDQGDEGAHFKHFAPRFPGADPSLERASELFAAFVFRKKGGTG